MEKINIKDLVKLLFLCVSILSVAVVIAYLLASVIVYFKIGIFYFDWKEAFSDAFRKGIVGGLILGFGLWIKAKLQEHKNKKRQ
ncbi:hypothetical protein C5E04_04145 [Pectobacterium parmentieri]|uniref:hypothetical protein n=1 Tax=Pectobacterium parmentieri TaxID=1905730 RepID=UPI000EB15E38|nr:hypothetical protein [Pectobacterium parmentieri]RKO81992.1 hypothetical protein C5E04_04145 [Pectobacterium parmentieri]